MRTLPEDPSRPPLLDYTRRGPDWIDWRGWARLTGTDLSGWPRRRCASYAQAVGQALAGEGIALGSRPLLEAEINAGRLRQVGPAHRTRLGYHLLRRSGGVHHADTQRLWQALGGASA